MNNSARIYGAEKMKTIRARNWLMEEKLRANNNELIFYESNVFPVLFNHGFLLSYLNTTTNAIVNALANFLSFQLAHI